MATSASQRIHTLDVIRGVAVMAILSVNIVGMAMNEQAYFYPPAYGFHSAGDKAMWALNSILVEGRFRALFSILFGASLTVVVTRADEAGKPDWQVHFPRMIALLLFGCVHYYALWWGDILVNYALIGLIAFFFWRLKPQLLVLAAVMALGVFYTVQIAAAVPVVERVERGLLPGASPELQAKASRALADVRLTPAAVESDKRDHASIAAHVAASAHGDAAWAPWESVPGYGLETLGFMLLGMAGLKSGFLTGALSRRSYAIIAAGCLGLDLLVRSYGAYTALRTDFDPLTFIPWTRVFVAPLNAVGGLGYAALIVLVLGRRGALSDRFAAVGRAAFTNYLGSTLIGALLFFGTFGGLYGELSRGEVWLFVPAIWAAMLLWSKPWLDRFNYGPFEWAWRSLARWKLQPMRKGRSAAVLAEA
jgi:uncharacterized protein